VGVAVGQSQAEYHDDGYGRSANDNNTPYLFAWLIF